LNIISFHPKIINKMETWAILFDKFTSPLLANIYNNISFKNDCYKKYRKK